MRISFAACASPARRSFLGLALIALTECTGFCSQPGPCCAKRVPPAARSITQRGGHTSGEAGGKITASFAGIEVSNLTPTAARKRVAAKLGPKLDVSILLTDGIHAIRRTRRELGIEIDAARMVRQALHGKKQVSLSLLADPQRLQRALRLLEPVFDAPARNAAVLDRHGIVKVTPGRPARRLAVAREAQWMARVITRRPWTVRFRAPIVQTLPRIPTSALRGINGRLSSFTTSYFPYGPHSANRNHNMMLGIWAIDGTIIPPGKVFSFNKVVGERTPDRGYLSGVMYQQGAVIEGIGAGLSQTAGTLCNAALFAGLPMVEFRTHSHPVPYLPVGRDGTVAFGSFDMRFRNNTRYPILISFKVDHDRTVATLYGRRTPGRSVTLTVHQYPLGPGHLKTVLDRTIKLFGKTVRQERIGSSEYHWQPSKPGAAPAAGKTHMALDAHRPGETHGAVPAANSHGIRRGGVHRAAYR